MTVTSRQQSILLAALVSAPTLLGPCESLAQDRTARRAGSLSPAIEEARRGPFHAGIQRTPLASARNEPGQVLRPLESRTFSRDRGDLAPKVLFYTLPVVVVLDGFFIYSMTQEDEGQERGRGDFSALRALAAILGPALVGRLAGARLPVAIVGSTLGFSGVAMATLMLGKPAYFLGPMLHAGATALLVAMGTR